MRKTKNIILAVILVIGGLFLLVNHQAVAKQTHRLLYYSPCNKPITYRIGSIDPRFGMSEEDLMQVTKQAADIWNTAEEKTIITYDPKSKLHIDLVYDERQSLETQIDQLEGQLNSDKKNLTPQIEQYKTMAADFENKLAQLNSDIDYWNKKGGAPPDVYESLVKRQEDLKQEAQQLNALAAQLNQSTDLFNSEVNNLNSTIHTFNNALETKPEEGLYDGQNNSISIYFDVNEDEFLHTLTHEFGHAIGLPHVADKEAIMFPYTTAHTTLANDDLIALQNLCRERNIVEILKSDIYILAAQVKKELNKK